MINVPGQHLSTKGKHTFKDLLFGKHLNSSCVRAAASSKADLWKQFSTVCMRMNPISAVLRSSEPIASHIHRFLKRQHTLSVFLVFLAEAGQSKASEVSFLS